MKNSTISVVLFSILFSARAFAGACTDLKYDDIRDLVTTCVTSSGVLVKRVTDAWQDTAPGGKVWTDPLHRRFNQFEAQAFCESQGLALPSGYPSSANGKYGFPDQDSDFVIAEKHGMRELFQDLDPYWSSSVYQDNPKFVYTFRSYDGFIGVSDRSRRYGRISARCVDR